MLYEVITTCYRIEEDENLSVISCANVPDQPAEGEVGYWQEIETTTPDELVAWLKSQTLHPLLKEDILTPEHSTLIDRYGQDA